MIPSVDPGIQVSVRNKRPADLTRFTSDNIVLFVRGATGSPETGFDLKLDGVSWTEWVRTICPGAGCGIGSSRKSSVVLLPSFLIQ